MKLLSLLAMMTSASAFLLPSAPGARLGALAAKESGVPEYRVYVAPKGTEEWAPVGCVTVPRGEIVAQAIFGNEESLRQAAVSAYPGLKGQDLDYGFNLAVFPDDPVRPAKPEDAARSTNPFLSFARDLTNPMNVK